MSASTFETRKTARVAYTGRRDGIRRLGTITGTDAQYVLIRLDGESNVGRYHKIWKLEYDPTE